MEEASCDLCPRHCKVDRTNRKGFCGVLNNPVIARAALHMWEEPCLSGKKGSGAIFFSGCSLGCVFCQNREIASGSGTVVTIERLAQICLELQAQGAHNINLVTAEQFLPAVQAMLTIAKAKGLSIPVVWNSGGYELPESIKALAGHVDIFLPDLKYLSSDLARKYSKAEDYPDHAKAAIHEMVKFAGPPVFDDGGMMKSGVIVRHLVLPGHTKEAMAVIRYLHETYGNELFISIMHQYTPMPGIERIYPELARPITKREYDKVVNFALELGVENAYIQEGKTAKESFIPAFDGTGVSCREE